MFLSVVAIATFADRAAAQTTELITDTVSYELVHGKMIVRATVNGRSGRFIMDTGGRNLLTSDSVEHYGVKILASESVGDVNGAGASMLKGVVPSLSVGPRIALENAPFLVTAPNNFFSKLGVAGLLGGEAFANACVIIDSRSRQLVITYPYRPKGVSRNDGLRMRMGQNFHSIVGIDIGGRTIDALFDTGAEDFLSLSDADFRALDDSGVRVVARGHGFYNVGIAGVGGVKGDSVYKLTIPFVKVGGKDFANVGALTINRSHTLLGLQLTEYGRVMVDYPRGLFFFFPFDDGATDISVQTMAWNVKILPIGKQFEVTATVGEIDLRAGERVWSINGVSLDDAPLDEGYIDELMNKGGGATGEIVVGVDKKSLRTVKIMKI